MPFDADTKAAMFVQCARLCCLCLKQCGTNIEVAHIIDERDGGSNDPDNGIPACFDCHQEIGAYNDKHPKGNKFRDDELKARRDHIYGLVESGALQAQIIAERMRQTPTKDASTLTHLPDALPHSKEAALFLATVMAPDGLPNALDRKFSLLREESRAQVLDGLLSDVDKNSQAISALGQIARSLTHDQAVIVTEQIVRVVTLFGDIDAKVGLLQNFTKNLVGSVDESLRLAFFEDLISVVKRDKYTEVNKLVPVLVNHTNAIPEPLLKEYVIALLDQAESAATRGAPAARHALASLPDDVAAAGIRALDSEYLLSHALEKRLPSFVRQYAHLAEPENREMLTDFVSLGMWDFSRKYSDF